jgi:hypothetical protein
MLQVIFAALFAFLIGLAFVLYGYRLFLVMLPIWGFFAGFWLGAQTIAMLLGGGFLATTTGWVVGFATGLLLAVLSYVFYFVGVAIVAGAFGAALGSGLMGAIGFDPGFLMAGVALVSALVAAGLTLLLNIQKYVIIVITALGGANAIVLSILLLLGRVELSALQSAGSSIQPVLQDSFFWGLAWVIVAILGVIWQIRSSRAYTFEKSEYVEGWG